MIRKIRELLYHTDRHNLLVSCAHTHFHTLREGEREAERPEMYGSSREGCFCLPPLTVLIVANKN